MSAKRRRDAVIAFLLLFGVMGSYSLLETARDTLFLLHASAAKLPFAYIATAVTVLTFTSMAPALNRRFGRHSLALLFGTITAGMAAGAALRPHHFAGTLLFYVGVGVAGTAMLVRTWELIDGLFTVSEAKKAFAPIAAGGALGAIVAGLVATHVHDPYVMAYCGAGVLGVTSLGPLFLHRAPQRREPKHDPTEAASLADARWLLLIAMLLTVASTVGDFLFKSSVGEHTSPAQLGAFFAKYNLTMNALGLTMQLLIAPALLRRFGPQRSVLALPAMTAGAAMSFIALPGFASGLLMKTVDAALRNSIHRPASEVYYIPLSPRIRGRVKSMVDGIGQRGGQAVAAVLLLCAQALGATTHELALLVVVSSAFSAWGTHRLRWRST